MHQQDRGKPVIRFRTIDLELVSTRSLEPLAEAFENRGLVALHLTRGNGGSWSSTLETCAGEQQSLEENLSEFLDVIESLTGDAHDAWYACQKRVFDIAFDSGETPRWMTVPLCAEILARIHVCGASLAITIYPPDRTDSAEQL